MKMFSLCKASVMMAIAFMLNIGSAEAISAGRTGQAYTLNDDQWYNVYIEDAKYKATAAMPGTPGVVLENTTMRVKSIYRDTYYFMSTQMASDEKPPKNYEALVKALGNLKGKVTQLKCKKDHVLYGLEYQYTNDEGLPGTTRVYVTKKKMYIVGALGKDLSRYDTVCDQFKVVKEEN